MAVQVKPAVISWTKAGNAHNAITVEVADAAVPAAGIVSVRFGSGFTTRDQIADALRRMAVLVTDPPGVVLVNEMVE